MNQLFRGIPLQIRQGFTKIVDYTKWLWQIVKSQKKLLHPMSILLVFGAFLLCCCVFCVALFVRFGYSLLKKLFKYVKKILKEWMQNRQKSNFEQTFSALDLFSKVKDGIRQSKLIRPSYKQITIHEGSKLTLDIALYKYEHDNSQKLTQGNQICKLQDNHKLIYNKRPIFRNDLILEHDQIDQKFRKTSVRQLIKVIKALDGLYLYNKGQESGRAQGQRNCFLCLNSQARNLRLIEKIQRFVQKILTNEDKSLVNKLTKFPQFEFQHYICVFQKSKSLQNLSSDIFSAYDNMKKALNINQKSSYNLMGTNSFLIMIPRRKADTYEGLRISASAFFGMVMTHYDQTYKNIRKHTPQDILKQVTFQINS